jgi:hypothetical protein
MRYPARNNPKTSQWLECLSNERLFAAGTLGKYLPWRASAGLAGIFFTPVAISCDYREGFEFGLLLRISTSKQPNRK